ncbi:MAG TPA: acyl-CoA synthetase, partial [Pseudonocardiaceae bacterium]
MPSESTAKDIRRARQHGVGDIPRRSAARHPDRPAIIDGDTRLTFAEFDACVDRVANAIAAGGIGKGERIAVLSHNCWQFAVLAFATARRGVVLVPVNFMLGATEIAYILDDCGAVAFVAEDGLSTTAEAATAESSGTVRLRLSIDLGTGTPPASWQDIGSWTEYDGASAEPVAVADDDPIRLMYTSGTESRPKGAIHTSRSLMWQYVSCAIDGGMSGDDIEVHSLPLYHCAQLDCFLSVDVYLGATSVILRGPDPATVLAAIAKHRATKLFSPPTVWISLLRSPDFDRTDLTSLTKGYYGASPMPVEVLRELGDRLPDIRLWNFYGQTELAPLATILQPEEQQAHAGSAGRPALNVDTRVVDEFDQQVPAGTVGEIVHRSPHATMGYFGKPEITARAFTNGWFHSGDLGVFDEDGYLTVVDRKKDMIKSGGENVASREVEEALYQHDAVAEVAVFGVAHPHWIEAVTAVVVPKAGKALTGQEISAFARTVLAGYKRPKYVILLDALPKNPSGKILKRELRERY